MSNNNHSVALLGTTISPVDCVTVSFAGSYFKTTRKISVHKGHIANQKAV